MPAVAAVDGGGAGRAGIGGDPAAIEAGADAAAAAAGAIEEAGRSVSDHGDTVVATWTGSASAAAHERIRFLGERTAIGADVLADLPAILTTYAQALRTAQARFAAGHAGAMAAASAASAAATAQAGLDAEGTLGVDPAHGQRQAAVTAAASAAAEDGAAAQHAMAAAVADEKVANAVAAAAVEALSGQMVAMRADMAPARPSPAAADWADGYHDKAATDAMRPSPSAVDYADYLARGGAAASVFGDDPGRGYGLSPATEAENKAAREAMKNNAAGVVGAAIGDVGFVVAALDAVSIGPDGFHPVRNFHEEMDKVDAVQEWAADLMGADRDSKAHHDGQTAYAVVTLATGAGGLVKGGVHLSEFVVAKTVGKKAAEKAAKEVAEQGAKEAPVDPRTLSAPLPKAPPTVPGEYAHLPVVDATSGVKGSRPPGGPAVKGTWNEELRHWQPDTVYRVDGRQLFITDEAGRVVHIKADLELRTGQDRADHTLSHAGDRVKDGPDTLPGDQSGHGIANSLGGPSEEINRFPMSSIQNLSGEANNWNAWENDMRKILQQDEAAGRTSDLRLDLQIVYPDDPVSSVRPQEFRVNVTDHGKLIVNKPFENTPVGASQTPAPVP